MNKLKYAEDTLTLQLNWISSADNKVPPLFAINAAMLGVITALLPEIALWDISTAIFTSLSVMPLIGSIICLALATFPRLDGPKGSIVFFSGIASKNEGAFIEEINNISEEALIEDALKQVYRNAEIASEKYAYIKKSMIQSFVSLPLWLLSVWFLYNL